MEESIVREAVGQFGAAGLFIAYLVWEKLRTSTIEEKRISAQERLAESLGALAELIRGLTK
jgi:hypothetical protein